MIRFTRASLVLISLLAATICGAADLSVPIIVKNPSDHGLTAQPLQFGMPLSIDDNIISIDELSLLNHSGQSIAAQFAVQSRWNGPSDDAGLPVKWLLVSVLADLAPNLNATWALVDDGGTCNEPAIAILADDAHKLVLDTHAAVFTIDKQHFNGLAQVSMSRPLLRKDQLSGFVVTDIQDRRYLAGLQGCDLSFLEKGPLKISIQIETTLMTETGLVGPDLRVIMTFFAGRAQVYTTITLGNHGSAVWLGGKYDVHDYEGHHHLAFSEFSFNLAYAGGSFLSADMSDAVGIQSLDENMWIYQDSSGTDYWNRYDVSDHPRPNSYSTFRGYRIFRNDHAVCQGDHYEGMAALYDNHGGLGVGIQNFWQTYPKGIGLSKTGMLSIQLFPEQPEGQYRLRVGEEISTTMTLVFSDQRQPFEDRSWKSGLQADAYAMPDRNYLVGHPALEPFALGGDGYIDRFGQFATMDDIGKYDYFNDRTLISDPFGATGVYYPFDSLWQGTADAPAAIDYFNMYGYNAYGNWPLDFEMYADGKAGYFNHKYDADWGAWMQYLRTDELLWREMALAMSAYTEQLMLHDITTDTGYAVELLCNAIFGHGYHNEPGNRNGQRNYAGPVLDTAWGVRGAALHHYLSGDVAGRRFVDKAAAYAYNLYRDRRDSQYLDGTVVRYMANLISILNEGLRLTGDQRYLDLILAISDYYAPDKQPYIDGPPGGGGSVSVWMLAEYLLGLARTIDTVGYLPDPCPQIQLKRHFLRYAQFIKDHCLTRVADYRTTYYNFNYNGAQGGGLDNNWILRHADLFAYAYRFTGNAEFLTLAADLFRTATHMPFCRGCQIAYSTTKEAVNHAVYGHAFLAYGDGMTVDEPVDSLICRPDAPDDQPTAPPPPDAPVLPPDLPMVEQVLPIIGDVTITTLAKNGNYGGSNELIAYNSLSPQYRVLLNFGLSEALVERHCTHVTLFLNVQRVENAPTLAVYPVLTPWKEGSGTYGNTIDGATWQTTGNGPAWRQAGGDMDVTTDYGLGPNGQIAALPLQTGMVAIDLSPLLDHAAIPPHGLMLTLTDNSYYGMVKMGAKESENPPVMVLRCSL